MEKMYLLLFNRILKKRIAKCYKEQIKLHNELSNLRSFIFEVDEFLKAPYLNETSKVKWINEAVTKFIEKINEKPKK